ncbi:MAG: 2-oxo acid dehydrogenase subunit E2 [Comamonadaceae bacterium]|nr:2-oxo acid dehydrogenase subunit E2 [Comamonadaceae bacterium]
MTVTNLGDQGVETVFGVIYPPQVAIVGFGRVAERPWVERRRRARVRRWSPRRSAADHRVERRPSRRAVPGRAARTAAAAGELCEEAT